MKEIHSFYAQLYKSEMESDVNQDNLKDFEDFTNELFIPRLSNPERDAKEGKLTIEECKEALNTFNSGKSPGEDGFTVEFYNTFFALLGKDLINCLNESYDLGEMSISQRRDVISLVPKDDSYLLLLSNWRPITLLNVDYKIASKAIAKRIESVLPKLIHSDQTGFIKDHYIGQNIRLLNDVLDQTKLHDIPGILLLLDFRKAFDTIEWSFVKRTPKAFNFGENIQQWIATFYAKTESSVLNNGFTTDSFPLSRGVRQGCPLSPYLFVLGVEILANKIRQSKSILGISIYGQEFKISQFADDTSLLCKDRTSVENALAVIKDFGALSGLRLNPTKTKTLWLGPWRNNDDKPFSSKWSKEPEKALGIFISYDEKGNYKKNFTTKIQKLGNKLDFWRSRNLTLLGRTLIFKCLGLPQLVYPASILETPQPQCSSLITTYMFNFLWNNKSDKIKREIMYLDYADGGLRVPKVNTMFKALKLAWIPRLLRDFDCNSEAWRVIPDAHLKRYGGLNFLLRCNYDRKCLDQGAIPSFYKEILVFFAELKKIHCSYDVRQDLILFNNSKIKIEGNTVFYKDWMNKGVFAVHDLLHETTGKFLSYQEFTKKYKVNCNFLTYFQVLSAIPKDLLEKARHYCFDKQHFDQTNSMSQLSSSISLNLMKTKCRDFYWLLNKSDVKATGLVKWEKDFQFADSRLKT